VERVRVVEELVEELEALALGEAGDVVLGSFGPPLDASR